MSTCFFFENFPELVDRLNEYCKKYSKIFFLTDENTSACCLLKLNVSFPFYEIKVNSGEENKNIQTLQFIWNELSWQYADRKSLLINLGGGSITDIGGFAAACYKRGIHFVHIPTTVLSMVDASIGGKTGIDFLGFKNQIGLFAEATQTFICPLFLSTLSEREKRSGFAEMFKHYLIADKSTWIKTVESNNGKLEFGLREIKQNIEIKTRIVAGDPYESGTRKALNFGHTIGHAIESFYLNAEKKMLHGEAIALGIICESFISYQNNFLLKNEWKSIYEFINRIFPDLSIAKKDIKDIANFCLQDKKNEDGKINLTLLNGIGNYQINQFVSLSEIEQALDYIAK